jgi:hypothetical protein
MLSSLAEATFVDRGYDERTFLKMSDQNFSADSSPVSPDPD